MGNQHSQPVYDDGASPINQNEYCVIGDLRAAEIHADTINCERIYVDRLKAHRVQLCGQSWVSPPPYQAFPPQRRIKCDDALNVRGTILAGSVKCKKLNAYDVFYTQDLDVGHTDVKDRNSVNEHLITTGQDPLPSGAQYYMNATTSPQLPQQGFGGPAMQQPMSHSPIPPPTYQQAPRPNFRGNFSHSAKDVSLDHKFYLVAQCADVQGQHRFSALDLNDHITNSNGQLQWVEQNNTGNFSGSCRSINLAEGGKVLIAEACAIDGTWRQSYLWLDERIGNENGELKFVS